MCNSKQVKLNEHLTLTELHRNIVLTYQCLSTFKPTFMPNACPCCTLSSTRLLATPVGVELGHSRGRCFKLTTSLCSSSSFLDRFLSDRLGVLLHRCRGGDGHVALYLAGLLRREETEAIPLLERRSQIQNHLGMGERERGRDLRLLGLVTEQYSTARYTTAQNPPEPQALWQHCSPDDGWDNPWILFP